MKNAAKGRKVEKIRDAETRRKDRMAKEDKECEAICKETAILENYSGYAIDALDDLLELMRDVKKDLSPMCRIEFRWGVRMYLDELNKAERKELRGMLEMLASLCGDRIPEERFLRIK